MRTFSVRMLAMAATASMLAGCNRSPTASGIAGALEITPDQPSYVAGSVVSLSLRNTTPLEVWYAACGSQDLMLQRRWLGGWVDTSPSAIPVLCMRYFDVVRPGQTNVEQVPLDRDQAPGTYRVLISESNDLYPGQRIYQASAPFEVRRR